MSSTDTTKFRLKRELPNKRRATALLDAQLKIEINRVKPQNFHSLVLPSVNLHDIHILRGHGVPDRNITIVERETEDFHLIKQACPDGDTTDSSLDLRKRLFLESGKSRYNWINLDLCGPIIESTLRCVQHVTGLCLKDRSFVWLTIKCGRDNNHMDLCKWIKSKYPKLKNKSTNTLQEQREFLCMYILGTIPKEHGYKICFYHMETYCEDKQDMYGKHHNGGKMMVAGAVYEKQ